MNILAVCQFYHPENFTITPLMRRLVEMGHQVTVVTGRPNAGFGRVLEGYRNRKFEIIDGVKVHRLPILARKKGKLSLVANYFSFYTLGRMFLRRHKGNYDIVFTVSLSPVISMVPAIDYARKHKLPLVEYCVDIWPESVVFTNNIIRDSVSYKYLERWSQKIYRAADCLIVGSPSYRDYMIREHGVVAAKIKELVQPAMVEILTCSPINYGDGHHLVYIGNLGQVQLLDELLIALKTIGDNRIHIHIVGEGAARERLEAYARQNGIDSNVHFYGTLSSDLAVAYIPNADALIVPLKDGSPVGKTIPNKLIMCLAFARPIIGALLGDGRTILEASGGGIIVTPSTAGLIEGIQRSLSLTTEEKNALGARNLQYFKQHFTLDDISMRLETYLSELVN